MAVDIVVSASLLLSVALILVSILHTFGMHLLSLACGVQALQLGLFHTLFTNLFLSLHWTVTLFAVGLIMTVGQGMENKLGTALYVQRLLVVAASTVAVFTISATCLYVISREWAAVMCGPWPLLHAILALHYSEEGLATPIVGGRVPWLKSEHMPLLTVGLSVFINGAFLYRTSTPVVSLEGDPSPSVVVPTKIPLPCLASFWLSWFFARYVWRTVSFPFWSLFYPKPVRMAMKKAGDVTYRLCGKYVKLLESRRAGDSIPAPACSTTATAATYSAGDEESSRLRAIAQAALQKKLQEKKSVATPDDAVKELL